MEIIIGKTAGFCYGVKRAVEGAKEELKKDKNIFCLGEIVHNKDVVKKLEEEGLVFIENIDDAKRKTLVRAHGITKEIYEKAKENNIELLDYTCPKVLKIHKIAEEYSNKGYYIFLLGSKNHPENIGTFSYCGKNKYIVEDENEVFKALDTFKKSGINKLLVIVQTTFSLEKFYIIEEIIKNELPKDIECIIKNTICDATEIRQKETKELSTKTDHMIIIGGKNSSNTKKLYDIARKNCKKATIIENEKDLDLQELKEDDKIGIMAGASTPKESIENVVNTIKEAFLQTLI